MTISSLSLLHITQLEIVNCKNEKNRPHGETNERKRYPSVNKFPEIFASLMGSLRLTASV